MPPTVIFFSSGISATTRTTGNLGTSSCDLSTDAYQNVGAAAAASRAHVYVVQADLTPLQRSDGLENLAGVTGSRSWSWLAPARPVGRVTLETAASYLPPSIPSRRNGTDSRTGSRCE